MLDTLMQAGKLGVRLAIRFGLPIWEVYLVWKPQLAIDQIRTAFLTLRCHRGQRECMQPVSGVDIRLPMVPAGGRIAPYSAVRRVNTNKHT